MKGMHGCRMSDGAFQSNVIRELSDRQFTMANQMVGIVLTRMRTGRDGECEPPLTSCVERTERGLREEGVPYMRAEHTARRIATDQSGPVFVDHFASSARKASPSAPLQPVFRLCQITYRYFLAKLRGFSADRQAVQLRWDGSTCSTLLPTKR